MHILNNIGIGMMVVATLSLIGLSIESAIRHGGEGMLIALGLATGALVPAWVGMRMAGVSPAVVAITATSWMTAVLAILGVIGIVLLWQRQREGFICLGLAIFLGAADYAIAPGYIAAQRTATVAAS